jgi:hypothetical protein
MQVGNETGDEVTTAKSCFVGGAHTAEPEINNVKPAVDDNRAGDTAFRAPNGRASGCSEGDEFGAGSVVHSVSFVFRAEARRADAR